MGGATYSDVTTNALRAGSGDEQRVGHGLGGDCLSGSSLGRSLAALLGGGSGGSGRLGSSLGGGSLLG